jgi:M6 family metalloprotease-like protein
MRQSISRLPILFGILLAASSLGWSQTAASPVERIQVLNQELVGLSTQPADSALSRVRALTAIRQAAFTDLAQSDPARALTLTLPAANLARLRAFGPEVASGLESDGEWSGPAEVVIEDDFQNHAGRTHLSIFSGGEWLSVYSSSMPPNLRSGATVRSTGVRMGRMILARDLSSVIQPNVNSCSSTGVQKIVVVMVNFLSSSIPAGVNSASIGTIVTGGGHSLTGYWNEASYGKTSATADVFGPYNLGADYTGSDYTTIQNAAINAAANTGGVNFGNYTHVVIIMPNGFPVGGGLGTVGCTGLTSPTTGAFTAGVVWLRADFVSPNDVGVCAFAHENGHNMGLNHASTESYGSVPLGSFGTVPTHNEYGSYFSLMSQCLTDNGTTLLGHYDAQHKVQLGWFAAANYQNVTSSGNFVLANTETSNAGLQAIRVQRGAGSNIWLWLEYRAATGYDSTFSALSSQIYSGAMIHFEDPNNATYAGYTRLLNFTAPANPDFSQPSLAVGQTWSDPYSLLTINPTSIDGSGLHVNINYDTPCATFLPTSRSYAGSGAVASDTVAITTTGTCSWTGVANDSWITVTGGASGTTSGTLTYSLTANTGPSPRTGTITIARQSFTITQASSNPQPIPVSSTPVNGSSNPGVTQPFSFLFSDGNGANDFTKVSLLVNTSTSGVAACNVAWFKSDNSLRLYDDAGDGGYSYFFANQIGTLSNSQCSVSFNNAVSIVGNNLTLSLNISFPAGFSGQKNIYMEAADPLGADSGWVLMGTWTVGTTVPITVTTNPPGLAITVDSIALVSPQSFNWLVGSNHTIATSSPQNAVGTTRTWSNWSDSGLISHSVVIPASSTTYTANFNVQYLLTLATNPPAGGTLTPVPSSGTGYYNSSTPVQLTAAPATGYTFSGFSGDLTGSVNPQSVTMSAPRSVTANFTLNPPAAVSVLPASGSGLQQTFTFHYSDGLGATDLSTAFIWFNSAFTTAANSCLIEYYRPGNAIYLFNDTGTGWIPATIGTGGVITNSQCSINTNAITQNLSGTDLTLGLPITFAAGYYGAKNTYTYISGSAANSGWQTLGNWTVPVTVSAVSVFPSAGTGLTQTFTVRYSDGIGASDLNTMFVWINAAFTSGAHSCFVEYAPSANSIYLLNDAGAAWLPAVVGSANVISNSQCSINAATTTVGTSGTDLALALPVTFAAGYAGSKSVFVYGAGGSANSGWQTLGTWNVSATVTGVNAVSVAPAWGNGLTQTFTIHDSDAAGAADLNTMFIWFNPTFSSAISSCFMEYYKPTNTLYLLNDAGNAWTSGTVGSGGTLTNSQCSVNPSAGSTSTSGPDLLINLPMTFAAGFYGPKNIYSYAQGASGNSGWQTVGAWTVPLVNALSVSPSSGNALSQTFTFHYSDGVGASDLSTIFVWYNTAFTSAVNSCFIEYSGMNNTLYLLNNAGNAWTSATLGSANVLSNSQCSVNAATATVVPSGTGLSLSLPVTFAAGYAGSKSVFTYAAGTSANSGWQTVGSWIVP